ncbi:hypothetical protein OKW41_008968 [Paraburkholderia sp. UCT70]
MPSLTTRRPRRVSPEYNTFPARLPEKAPPMPDCIVSDPPFPPFAAASSPDGDRLFAWVARHGVGVIVRREVHDGALR